MKEQLEYNAEDYLSLFKEAGLTLDTNITYAIVVRADFFQIKKLNDFIMENKIYVAYRKSGMNKLYITTERGTA